MLTCPLREGGVFDKHVKLNTVRHAEYISEKGEMARKKKTYLPHF